MAQLVWDESYTVGVAEFDFHHKRIFFLINQLRKMLREDSPPEEMSKLVIELSDYANSHLKREEEMFAKYVYEESVDHKKYHDKYRVFITESMNALSDKASYNKLLLFLEDWWLEHIQTEDKKYAKFFNSKGVF